MSVRGVTENMGERVEQASVSIGESECECKCEVCVSVKRECVW